MYESEKNTYYCMVNMSDSVCNQQFHKIPWYTVITIFRVTLLSPSQVNSWSGDWRTTRPADWRWRSE